MESTRIKFPHCQSAMVLTNTLPSFKLALVGIESKFAEVAL